MPSYNHHQGYSFTPHIRSLTMTGNESFTTSENYYSEDSALNKRRKGSFPKDGNFVIFYNEIWSIF